MAEIKPAEISAILKKQLSDFGSEASVEEGPNVSLIRRSQALGISGTSLQNQIDTRTEFSY